ncbi:hypothetical protein [Herbaspirillum robiniae]|uniref:hypothetical protein n=1 Tax=Herbaspirillum robiniae TaxID=2014887 RepID=UPI003D77E971
MNARQLFDDSDLNNRLVAEFDDLWQKPPSVTIRERMDVLIGLIEKHEAIALTVRE